MGHYVACVYVPIRTPGGLLRKPPLKCALMSPAQLAYPLDMLTQHGYVAAR